MAHPNVRPVRVAAVINRTKMDFARRRRENEYSLPYASAYPGDSMEAIGQLHGSQHVVELS